MQIGGHLLDHLGDRGLRWLAEAPLPSRQHRAEHFDRVIEAGDQRSQSARTRSGVGKDEQSGFEGACGLAQGEDPGGLGVHGGFFRRVGATARGLSG